MKTKAAGRKDLAPRRWSRALDDSTVWYVYIIESHNGALYTGIARDLQARLEQHRRGRGARFFRTTAPRALVYAERKRTQSGALRREAAIKALTRTAKLALIASRPLPAYAVQRVSSNAPKSHK